MSDAEKGLEKLERPITEEEKSILFWLIEHSNAQHHQLASQVELLRVVTKCTCGCPTVYFAIAGDPPTRKGERIISDYLADVDGQDVGVLLFELDGKLSSLEVYSCAGHNKPFGLPKIDRLYAWEDASKRGASLTQETLRKSAKGEDDYRAEDSADLFRKLGM
jgi:hypothetical protein